jgi:hypothetical protein
MPPEAIREALLTLARQRGQGSFCPSDAARALAPVWRPLMAPIRAAAGALCDEGLLRATQRGAPVDPRSARGPIRLRLAQDPG